AEEQPEDIDEQIVGPEKQRPDGHSDHRAHSRRAATVAGFGCSPSCVAVDGAHTDHDEIRQTDPEQAEHTAQDPSEPARLEHDARITCWGVLNSSFYPTRAARP